MLVLLAMLACTPSSDTGQEEEGPSGRLTEADGMRVLQMWGTRDEMGYAEGALMCEEMVDVFEAYILEYLVADYEIPYELVLAMAENAIVLEEADERELQGLYQGALDHCTEEQLTLTSEHLEPAAGGSRRIDWYDLVAANALADFGCSSFSAWGDATVTGDVIYGRNFDWAVDPRGTFLDAHVLKVYDSEEEGRFASVGVPGLTGCISCLTEEGIGLFMHNVQNAGDPSQQTGIDPRTLTTRRALAATQGAEEPVTAAEGELEALPMRAASNLHMPMPAARGVPVVLEVDGDQEHADGQVTVRVPGFDPTVPMSALANTNHFVQRAEPLTSGDSANRYAGLVEGTHAAAAGARLDLDGAWALMDHVANVDGLTLHTVLYDAAAQDLRIYVSEAAEVSATEYEPAEVHLPDLFDALP